MREKKGKVNPLWVNCEREERCIVDLAEGSCCRRRGDESQVRMTARTWKSLFVWYASLIDDVILKTWYVLAVLYILSSSLTSTTGSSSQQEKGIHFPYDGLHRDL